MPTLEIRSLCVALAVLALSIFSQFFGGPSLINPVCAQAGCVAKDNLRENAQSFIGRCRRGSINNEFPSEMYTKTVGAIKNGSTAAHRKAWKLLNDNRFKK